MNPYFLSMQIIASFVSWRHFNLFTTVRSILCTLSPERFGVHYITWCEEQSGIARSNYLDFTYIYYSLFITSMIMLCIVFGMIKFNKSWFKFILSAKLVVNFTSVWPSVCMSMSPFVSGSLSLFLFPLSLSLSLSLSLRTKQKNPPWYNVLWHTSSLHAR